MYRTNKFLRGFAAAASVAACALPGAVLSGPALAEDFAVTIASGHPPVTKGVALLHDFFIPEVNKRLEALGHTVSWTEAYGGSLAGVNEVLEAVEGGITDFGYVPTIFEADKLPLEQVTYVTPFGSADVVTLAKVMDELHARVPALNKAWEDHNQKLLATAVVDSYHMLSTFEWHDVSELKGRKIATGGLATNWLRGTEAAPLSGALPMYYNAVKTGLAEGIIIFESGIAPYKFYEVAPYITKLNYGTQASSALSVNLDTWNRFPEDARKAIQEVADAYEVKVAEEYQKLADASLEKSVANGAKVVDFAPEARKTYAQKMPNIAQEWAKDLDSRGQPGSETLKAYLDAAKEAGVTYARDWMAE